MALTLVVLLGLFLRLHGIHDPLLDHPGWRQGDTAAIARNFATLDFNPLHPQTDYDGPPPNYVELELQIVPFIAATLYKVFGIHEIFGRLITLCFSLATIVVLAYFARRLVAGDGPPGLQAQVAGIVAAALFAVYPGSVYYGRTFTPDTTMVFFLTAALFATARLVASGTWRGFWPAALLFAAAILAKPVAVIALIPAAVASVARFGLLGTLRRGQTWALLALALVPYAAYDAYLSRIAEWHWSSGITTRHVIPALAGAFGSAGGFGAKLAATGGTVSLLGSTMLGPWGLALFALAIVVPVVRPARPLLFGWLAAVALYAFAVVTVERVDYYLYPVLPLAALWIGARRGARHSAAAGARRAAPRRGSSRDRCDRDRRRRRPPAGGTLLRLQPSGVSAREGARCHVAARHAGRDGSLRSVGALLHQPQGLGRGPVPLDAVRRGERDPQGRALLHRDREQPAPPQRRALRLAAAVSDRAIRTARGRCTRPTTRRCCPAPRSAGASSAGARRPANSRRPRRPRSRRAVKAKAAAAARRPARAAQCRLRWARLLRPTDGT